MMRTMAGPLTVISLFWYGSAHWQVTPSLSLISFTNSHVLYFFISFIFSLFLHSNAANILMFLILIPWYLFSVHILFRLNSDLGGYQFRLNNGVPEYKAGADAAWVPFRQVPKLIASYNGNAEYVTITKTYTAVTDSVIIAIAMGVTGNDYVSAAYSPSTSAKITGKGSVSIAFNQKIYGNNTNLSRPGMGILSTYICTLKNGDELTVSIIPFESQFRSGYNIVFLQS